MIVHQMRSTQRWLLLAVSGMVILLAIWSMNQIAFVTGHFVPVAAQPYHQLAYTKLSEDHGSNFIGDIYLLDVDTGETTQLTQGGQTSARRWASYRTLDFVYRPRGSVTQSYYLDVQDGTGVSAHNGDDQGMLRGQHSNDGQRLVTSMIGDEWQATGYIVIEINGDQAETLMTVSDAYMQPQWLPNNEAIAYPASDDKICIHAVEQDDRQCITGWHPTVSDSVMPMQIAYTTLTQDVYQVCIARIENNRFAQTACYDSNASGFATLLWR